MKFIFSTLFISNDNKVVSQRISPLKKTYQVAFWLVFNFKKRKNSIGLARLLTWDARVALQNQYLQLFSFQYVYNGWENGRLCKPYWTLPVLEIEYRSKSKIIFSTVHIHTDLHKGHAWDFFLVTLFRVRFFIHSLPYGS